MIHNPTTKVQDAPLAHAANQGEEKILCTGAQGIQRALAQAMRKDERVFVMGEGARDPKGIFGTTLGLKDEFPESRVLEMPLSENGWTGIAIGAALAGQRPVIVHQRVEFSLLSLEQLFNQAAKAFFLSAGKHRVPLVVRLVIGRGWGQGPMHAQSLESIFCSIPGLKVVMPSTAADAQSLLLGAIEDDNPVVFLEHRWMHHSTAELPLLASPAPLDGPKQLRSGTQATVVSTSYMTLEAMAAVDALADEGCKVDLFDLRVLAPLDLSAITASLRKSGRLVTIDTGHKSHGIGAEVTAQLCEECFDAIQQPPLRIGLPDYPVPSSAGLAAHYYPRSPQIAGAIGELCGLSLQRCAKVVRTLEEQSSAHPIDVPNPSFKGPF